LDTFIREACRKRKGWPSVIGRHVRKRKSLIMCKWEILQEEEALSKSEDLLGRRGAGYVSWRDLLGRGQEGNNTCNSQGEDGLGKLIADICDE
jgi:hypothetical protein